MITVSSITKNTGRYADTYRIFHIPVNFVFNLPHYVTSYMHHTSKKESKKKVTKNVPQGSSNPNPQTQLALEVNASIYWTTSINASTSGLKEVYIPYPW